METNCGREPKQVCIIFPNNDIHAPPSSQGHEGRQGPLSKPQGHRLPKAQDSQDPPGPQELEEVQDQSAPADRHASQEPEEPQPSQPEAVPTMSLLAMSICSWLSQAAAGSCSNAQVPAVAASLWYQELPCQERLAGRWTSGSSGAGCTGTHGRLRPLSRGASGFFVPPLPFPPLPFFAFFFFFSSGASGASGAAGS